MSEGSEHRAKFKDDARVYNLKRDIDLKALRDEIERRMMAR
jgi:hypothetical protein